jgi:hypothetical protein
MCYNAFEVIILELSQAYADLNMRWFEIVTHGLPGIPQPIFEVCEEYVHEIAEGYLHGCAPVFIIDELQAAMKGMRLISLHV